MVSEGSSEPRCRVPYIIPGSLLADLPMDPFLKEANGRGASDPNVGVNEDACKSMTDETEKVHRIWH